MRLRASTWVLAAIFTTAAACSSTPSPRSGVSSARRVASDTLSCLDTLHARDSISTVVRMTVVPRDTSVELPREFEGLFIDAFRSRLAVPKKLQLSVVTGWQPCDSLGYRCVGGVLNLSAAIYVTAHNDGTLSDATIVDETLTPGFANSLRAALAAMSREREVPPTGAADSIPLRIRISPRDTTATGSALDGLFRAVVPRYNWPFSYATMPEAGIDARYPLNARLAGIEDSVTVAFTVGPDGTIAEESIDLVNGNYEEFVLATFNALLKARYHPAHLGDCAVATRIRQRFMFRAPQ